MARRQVLGDVDCSARGSLVVPGPGRDGSVGSGAYAEQRQRPDDPRVDSLPDALEAAIDGREGGNRVIFLKGQLRRDPLQVAGELDVLDPGCLVACDLEVRPGRVELADANVELGCRRVEVDCGDSRKDARRQRLGEHVGGFVVSPEEGQLARGIDRQVRTVGPLVAESPARLDPGPVGPQRPLQVAAHLANRAEVRVRPPDRRCVADGRGHLERPLEQLDARAHGAERRPVHAERGQRMGFDLHRADGLRDLDRSLRDGARLGHTPSQHEVRPEPSLDPRLLDGRRRVAEQGRRFLQRGDRTGAVTGKPRRTAEALTRGGSSRKVPRAGGSIHLVDRALREGDRA